MYKRASASWAGQELEYQPKIEEGFVQHASRAIENITTALASVGSVLFHNTPKGSQ